MKGDGFVAVAFCGGVEEGEVVSVVEGDGSLAHVVILVSRQPQLGCILDVK